MSAWLVKTRRSPSRYGRGARVHGHTTTATHKLSTPPPPKKKMRGLVIRERFCFLMQPVTVHTLRVFLQYTVLSTHTVHPVYVPIIYRRGTSSVATT